MVEFSVPDVSFSKLGTMDLSPTAIEAGVLQYHCGSLRSLFESSPRREFNIWMEFGARHQFSAPYKSTGKMQVSTTDFPDTGESCPCKRPMLP